VLHESDNTVAVWLAPADDEGDTTEVEGFRQPIVVQLDKKQIIASMAYTTESKLPKLTLPPACKSSSTIGALQNIR